MIHVHEGKVITTVTHTMMTLTTSSRVRAPAALRQRAARTHRSSARAGAARASLRVALHGAYTPTGRLLAGLLASQFSGANVSLFVTADDVTTYVPQDMPDDVLEQRFNASAKELKACAVIDEMDTEAVERAVASSDVVVIAHESGARAAVAVKSLRAARSGARVIALSRVGVNRRQERPFVDQNVKQKTMVSVGQMQLPIGGDVPGSVGLLDAFAQAEETIAAEARERGFTCTVVRSGQLRGNGPLLLADLSARMVDNLYDVKFQDLYVKRGDVSEGYTKRLNLAAVMRYLVEPKSGSSAALPEDIEVLSVVTKTNFFGEQTLTQPTDRERRKGYDMAKGRAPPAVDADTIERLLAEI